MVALLSNLGQDEAGDGASNRSGLIRQLSILSSCLGQRFFLNDGTGGARWRRKVLREN